ncbi:DsbA family oxidoreductase [bacterium]|nr:MAG: DsbA family oxidoreductase [bacterium]
MTAKVRIDYVSDVACPWCAIGLHSLEKALERTRGVVDADVTFQPFELNPDMPPEGQNVDEHLAAKYGMSLQQLAAGRAPLRERAAALGFDFNQSERSRMYNTFDAHRLLHWAKTEGRQLELKLALFKANFSDDVNVSDREELARIAESVGLDGAEARAVLGSDRYAKDVRDAERLWTSRGIQGVPGIVLNEKYLISGGQPPEVFEQALRKIADEAASA